MDIENRLDDLTKRIKEARKTGILRLKEGDGGLIAACLELYIALFETGGDTT